jgi:hypothetical protein
MVLYGSTGSLPKSPLLLFQDGLFEFFALRQPLTAPRYYKNMNPERQRGRWAGDTCQSRRGSRSLIAFLSPRRERVPTVPVPCTSTRGVAVSGEAVDEHLPLWTNQEREKLPPLWKLLYLSTWESWGAGELSRRRREAAVGKSSGPKEEKDLT